MEGSSPCLDIKTLHNLRVVDLKDELEKRGLSKSGSKKELVKRLKTQLEFEQELKLSKERTDNDAKLQLDEKTEQNEFVKQYLAQQQKRRIEEEIQRSSTASEEEHHDISTEEEREPKDMSEEQKESEQKNRELIEAIASLEQQQESIFEVASNSVSSEMPRKTKSESLKSNGVKAPEAVTETKAVKSYREMKDSKESVKTESKHLRDEVHSRPKRQVKDKGKYSSDSSDSEKNVKTKRSRKDNDTRKSRDALKKERKRYSSSSGSSSSRDSSDEKDSQHRQGSRTSKKVTKRSSSGSSRSSGSSADRQRVSGQKKKAETQDITEKADNRLEGHSDPKQGVDAGKKQLDQGASAKSMEVDAVNEAAFKSTVSKDNNLSDIKNYPLEDVKIPSSDKIAEGRTSYGEPIEQHQINVPTKESLAKLAQVEEVKGIGTIESKSENLNLKEKGKLIGKEISKSSNRTKTEKLSSEHNLPRKLQDVQDSSRGRFDSKLQKPLKSPPSEHQSSRSKTSSSSEESDSESTKKKGVSKDAQSSSDSISSTDNKEDSETNRKKMRSRRSSSSESDSSSTETTSKVDTHQQKSESSKNEPSNEAKDHSALKETSEGKHKKPDDIVFEKKPELSSQEKIKQETSDLVESSVKSDYDSEKKEDNQPRRKWRIKRLDRKSDDSETHKESASVITPPARSPHLTRITFSPPKEKSNADEVRPVRKPITMSPPKETKHARKPITMSPPNETKPARKPITMSPPKETRSIRKPITMSPTKEVTTGSKGITLPSSEENVESIKAALESPEPEEGEVISIEPAFKPVFDGTRKMRFPTSSNEGDGEEQATTDDSKKISFLKLQKYPIVSSYSIMKILPDWKWLNDPPPELQNDAPQTEDTNDLANDDTDEVSDQNAILQEEIEIENATNILLVRNLVRPFTLIQLKDLLLQTGNMIEDKFWIDKIKSKCFVTYESVEEAIKTRRLLNNSRWPVSNPKTLIIEFSNEEEMQFYKTGTTEAPRKKESSQEPDHLLPVRERSEERHGTKKKHHHVREWDIDKVRQESPERKRRKSMEKESRKKESKRHTTEETPAKLLDDLFKKTKSVPCIYWLPLSDEHILEREEMQRLRKLEREKRQQLQETRRRSPDGRRSSSRTRSRSPRRR